MNVHTASYNNPFNIHIKGEYYMRVCLLCGVFATIFHSKANVQHFDTSFTWKKDIRKFKRLTHVHDLMYIYA